MKNKQTNQKDTLAHQRPNKLSFADEWEQEEEDNKILYNYMTEWEQQNLQHPVCNEN